MDAKFFAAVIGIGACIVGGVAFGVWMGSAAAGWFMACALLVLAD